MKQLSQILKLVFILVCLSGPIFAQKDTATTAPQSAGIDSVKKNKILIYPGFGVSLVRNELAPVFYINLGINHEDRYEVNINTSSFFFFERDIDKNYKVYR